MTRQSLLVVEDDPTTRKVLRRYFQFKGWEVRLASTVAEGLAQLEPPPDCVILDLMLPGEGGEVVLRRIREGRLPTRVAVCTGTDDRDRLEAVATLRPDAVLLKPIAMADICQACGVH